MKLKSQKQLIDEGYEYIKDLNKWVKWQKMSSGIMSLDPSQRCYEFRNGNSYGNNDKYGDIQKEDVYLNNKKIETKYKLKLIQ